MFKYKTALAPVNKIWLKRLRDAREGVVPASKRFVELNPPVCRSDFVSSPVRSAKHLLDVSLTFITIDFQWFFFLVDLLGSVIFLKFNGSSPNPKMFQRRSTKPALSFTCQKERKVIFIRFICTSPISAKGRKFIQGSLARLRIGMNKIGILEKIIQLIRNWLSGKQLCTLCLTIWIEKISKVALLFLRDLLKGKARVRINHLEYLEADYCRFI